jgi:hypothetical protein
MFWALRAVYFCLERLQAMTQKAALVSIVSVKVRHSSELERVGLEHYRSPEVFQGYFRAYEISREHLAWKQSKPLFHEPGTFSAAFLIHCQPINNTVHARLKLL